MYHQGNGPCSAEAVSRTRATPPSTSIRRNQLAYFLVHQHEQRLRLATQPALPMQCVAKSPRGYVVVEGSSC